MASLIHVLADKGKNVNRLASLVGYLRADSALPEPVEICVRPAALSPGRDVAQVVRQVDRVQLVVDELADVPRQVIVPRNKDTNITKHKISAA